MKKYIEEKLRELTSEEIQILNENNVVIKNLYTNNEEFIIDIDKIAKSYGHSVSRRSKLLRAV